MTNIDLLISHVHYLLDKTGAIIRTGPSGCSVFNKKEGIRFENSPNHPSACKIGLFQEAFGVSFPKLEVEIPCSEVMSLIDELYQKQKLYHEHVNYHGHDTKLLSLVEEGLQSPQLEFLHNLVNLENYKILMTIEDHDYYLDIPTSDLRESNLIGSLNISIESASKTIDVSSELQIRYTDFYKYPILQKWQPKPFKIENLLNDFFEEAKKNFHFVQAYNLEKELSKKDNTDKGKSKTKI